MSRGALAAVVACAWGGSLFVPLSAARAQGTAPAPAAGSAPASDPAMAQVLFDEAKGLMTIGNNAAACPKLAESYRLDPGTGTLTALAVCNELIGKIATAWAEFLQVVAEARQAGRADREQFAQQHIAELEPKLSKLAVAIEPNVSSAPGFEVRRDGVAIGPAGWGTVVPVDPGEHVVEARADGKKPWWVKLTFGRAPAIKTVTVPILEDETDPTAAPAPWILPGASTPSAEPTAPAPADHSATPGAGFAGMSPSTQRILGLTLGGVGVVAAGLGTGFGVDAISKSNDAKSRCPSSPCTDASAVNTNNDAKTAAVIADVAIVGAILTLGAGAALYFTAPAEAAAKREEETSRARAPRLVGLRLVPAVSPQGGGVLLDARW